MKIWLDDERDPYSEYCQNKYKIPSGIIWVKDPNEAIRLIKSGLVTYISFDHDLGTELTGYDVAKVIENAAANGILNVPIKWHIHSMNPVGYNSIFRCMENADKYFLNKDN